MITLTPKDVVLIQDSWQGVVPLGTAAAALFYERLFQLDPALTSLLAQTDMQAQERKLVATLDAVVQTLDAPDVLLEDLRALGRRHTDYGTRPADYDTVGAALLWTLGEALGTRFTPEVRAAWTAAYALVAGVMRDASARGCADDDGRAA